MHERKESRESVVALACAPSGAGHRGMPASMFLISRCPFFVRRGLHQLIRDRQKPE